MQFDNPRSCRSLLFCTWGDAGAAAFEKKTGDILHVPAYTEGNMRIAE